MVTCSTSYSGEPNFLPRGKWSSKCKRCLGLLPVLFSGGGVKLAPAVRGAAQISVAGIRIGSAMIVIHQQRALARSPGRPHTPTLSPPSPTAPLIAPGCCCPIEDLASEPLQLHV